MKTIENQYGLIINEKITLSLSQFQKEMASNELFMHFMELSQDLVHENIDKIKERMKEAHSGEKNERIKGAFVKYLDSEAGNALFNLETYELHFGQMAFARVIDNVLTYFKDILKEVVEKVPDLLKTSKEKESHEYIWRFNNLDDLKSSIVEKKVEQLFYSGINTIEKYFESHLKIKLFETPEKRDEFADDVKTRNLIVHNRGRVTKEYLEEFPHHNLQVEDAFLFTNQDLSLLNRNMNNFLSGLDRSISTKYNLELIENGMFPKEQ